jgi:glycosyltransferase involved in cell wall biosynthesis
MRILLSAYACEPRKGSEPGVGWSTALLLSGRHDVWVLTRDNNRQAIERELARSPLPRLHFVYHDLPSWTRWWKRKHRGVQLYYYLWQIAAYRVAQRLHREIGFELIHHVTFGKYWAPSLLARLPVPFVWGPVGGAESAPRAFWSGLSARGILFEALRELGRWLGDHDPRVRLTIRRSTVALAKAGETAERLRRLGARDVRVFFCTQLLMAEVGRLISQIPAVDLASHEQDRVRFISIGRLAHLKGFHLGLRAFARANLENADYWLIGDGPERKRLESEARTLGIAGRVVFWGWISQEEALRRLAEAHVLVHPALHDSGGGPILEAMAMERPVICLDLGGPALRVTEETGIKIPAGHPLKVEHELAAAMRRLAGDPALRDRMGRAGRQWSARTHGPEVVSAQLDAIYEDARLEQSRGRGYAGASRGCVDLRIRDREASGGSL